MPRYRFFRRGEGSGEVFRRFSDLDEAAGFLRKASADPDTLDELRRWAHDGGASQRRDRNLLRYAAAQLVSGGLRVGARSRPMGDSHGGMQSEDDAIANEAKETVARTTSSGERATPSMLRAPQSAPAPATPQAPAQPTVNIAQQIATLLAAARNGTPFCEQCEKAKAEAAE